MLFSCETMFGIRRLLSHLLLFLLVVNTCKAEEEVNKESEKDTDPLPGPLSSKEFEEKLKSGYHIVEFFSPYCPHCVHFAPTWADFYHQHHEDYAEKNNLYFHQVNCVSNGDLCDEEGVMAYPTIRFYSSGGKLLGSMDDYKRTMDGLEAFINDQLSLWASDNADSSSTELSDSIPETILLNKKQLVQTLVGEGADRPYLVSFWQSTDKELPPEKFQGDHKEVRFFQKHSASYTFRNVWNGVAKRLSNEIEDGKLSLAYFNCGSNPDVCETLGFEDWPRNEDEAIPQIMMMLPSSAGGNRIVYNRPNRPSIQDLLAWTGRLLEMYKFEDLSESNIQSMGNIVKRLRRESDIKDYSKVTFVLLEDPISKVPEDDMILRKLLQPIMDLRDNVYLFKSTDNIGFLRLLKTQSKVLENDYLNKDLDKDSEDRISFDPAMFAARTLSALPMMLCFRSNTLDGVAMKSFSSRDIRDTEKVLKFIYKNAYPMAWPLLRKNMDVVFPDYDDSYYSKNEKVLVSLIDLKKPKELQKISYAMSYIYHKFSYIQNRIQFDKLDKERKGKYAKIKDLQDGEHHHDIMKIMSTKVKETFENMHNELRITYVDIENFRGLRYVLGWKNMMPSKYKSGDFILVSRFSNSYWDHSPEGKPFNLDDMDNVVSGIKYASEHSFSGNRLYTPILKFTAFGSLTIIVIYQVWKRTRKYILMRRLRRNRVKGLGILGVDPSLDSTELDKLE